MNIGDGLKIKENQFINWKISFENFIDVCKKNYIDYQIEQGNMLKKIVLHMEFANLGKVKANFYFINEVIKEIYISNENETEFNIDKFAEIKNKLILYFGTPKFQNNEKTIWNFNKIQIKHFYIKKDDITMDYLVLENNYI